MPDELLIRRTDSGSRAHTAFLQALDEHRSLFDRLGSLAPVVEHAAHLVAQSLRAGGKLMLCGNGGSAADSQHIAAELTGRFQRERPPMAALALSVDTSALTCIGNDYGFAEVFARQVRGIGRRGDCLVAISTSGRSPNVLRAVAAANELGICSIALTGSQGGPVAEASRLAIRVPGEITARIQEAHIFIGHALCALVDDTLWPQG